MSVYLVSGPTGAGKTTFARALAADEGAVCFSIDQWMSELFWPDRVPGEDYRWALERVERCERQIWAVSKEILATGGQVVLDLGFTEKTQRARFLGWAAEADFETITYLVSAAPETRKQRVHGRNRERGETFALHVTDEMFDFMEGLFEPPTEEECGRLRFVETG